MTLCDRSIRLFCFAALSTVCAACTHTSRQIDEDITLRFLGESIFPTGYQYNGFEVGGLSGIDYDPARDRYYAISDDRSRHGPSRFFELQIDLSDGTLDPGDVVFTGVTQILDKNGEAFEPLTVDPEAIRFSPGSGALFWTSEGDTDVAPFVGVMTRDGQYIDEFAPPAKYVPTADAGTRRNKAFESLTFANDPGHIITATENALRQDGPHASLAEGSPARILILDAGDGAVQAEYIYVTEPVAAAPIPQNSFATNGLVELLSFDASRLLALERSYSNGAGNIVKLFLISMQHATDVHELDSIAQHDIRPVEKDMIFDFDFLGLSLDNIEGMTFGPRLADGSRTLIFVSDNNFNSKGHQFTQFLAFKLSPDSE